MKKWYMSVMIFMIYFSLINAGIPTVDVPDANFRAVLSSNYGITFDESNNITNLETAAGITELNLNNQGIADLTGIEAFTGLQTLYCQNNQITSINFHSNTELQTLYCQSNQLTVLDFSINTELTFLYCPSNNLTSIIIDKCPLLNYVSCSSNSLTILDVSFNTALTGLICNNNQLTNLDVSSNTALTSLYCGYNLLTSLDISACGSMDYFSIEGNPTPFLLSVGNVSTFPTGLSEFTDTTPASTKLQGSLPVELISFTSTGNNLVWSTATETNNMGWEIESRQWTTDNRQQINLTFLKIGFVSGKGTTTEKQNYSFPIQSSTSIMEYRLKQLDSDGNFSYTKVLSVEPNISSFFLSQNYPNPFNPTTRINYQLPENSHVKITVFDLLGREVKTLVNKEISAGQHDVSFDASSLPSGVYIYKLTAGNFSETKKMMLVK